MGCRCDPSHPHAVVSTCYSRRPDRGALPRLGLVAAQHVHSGWLPVDEVEGQVGAKHGGTGRE